jgi:mannose-6-phosphate isomerase
VNELIRFAPHIRPLVWGGRRLELLGKSLPPGVACGEAWEISDHPSHRSVIAAGQGQGRTLRHLMEHQRPALLGQAAQQYETFPWLVKYLDACDWLSVQVHPDEQTVTRLWPGEGGKTEAWFVLQADPGSLIYAGLRPGVTEVVFRRALAGAAERVAGEGWRAEGKNLPSPSTLHPSPATPLVDCLHGFEPQPGDCLFLPAGTVHAVGGGVLLAEVQQTSDATFRLYDWDRRDAQGNPRQLHVEQALACIDWSRGPVQPVRAKGYPVSPHRQVSTEPVWQRLVACRYFTLEYLRQTEPFTLPGGSRMQVLMVLHGQGVVHSPESCQQLQIGDTLLLPACLTEARCVPDGSLGVLLSTLPVRVSDQ